MFIIIFLLYDIIITGDSMIYELKTIEELNKIKPFFNEIRFYMGKSVLDKTLGCAYTDNIEKPNIAFLVVRRYCFISGNIKKDILKKIIDENFRDYKLIPSDNLIKEIEEIYKDNIIKSYRYSIKKDPIFNISKLNSMKDILEDDFKIVKIDKEIANKINHENFIKITDNFEENGIGFCCLKNNEIIGVASSNIFYKDGIEVNIKVKEEYRRKKIATSMAANLTLECIRRNKKISWDAANINSVKLAEKLGFSYDSKYIFYTFNK